MGMAAYLLDLKRLKCFIEQAVIVSKIIGKNPHFLLLCYWNALFPEYFQWP